MPSVELEPVLDWILVKRAKEKTQLIVVPSGANEPVQNVYWHVLKVGPGRPSEYSGERIVYDVVMDEAEGIAELYGPVLEGELILASSGAGSRFEHPELGEVRFMRPSDVLAIVTLGGEE